uniref:Cell adhesion molecule 3 n=1 Tax=Cynoglossus semilaevis TaxID=244447 RepID=A0A3P8X3R9_CYNSE
TYIYIHMYVYIYVLCIYIYFLHVYMYIYPVTSDETVSVGGTVTLTCRVAESDNSSLQWSNTAQLHKALLFALRDHRIQLHRSTSTELSITIDDVQLSDEGEYTCSIFTMPVRTARATVTVLGVPAKPHISGFESAVPEGDKVTLTCTSTGSKPPARLIWYRGDQELEGEDRVCDDPTYNVSSELTLEVNRHDDGALVTCAVDHPSLAPGDKRSELSVQLPSLCVSFFLTNVPVTGPLSRSWFSKCLFCRVSHDISVPHRPMSYLWRKKDDLLPPMAKADGAFLRFERLNKSDNGVYLCHADNGIGSSEGEYALLVQVSVQELCPSCLTGSHIFPALFILSLSDPTAMLASSGVDHAVIGGVVAVIVFILLCLLIVLGRYLIRHKGQCPPNTHTHTHTHDVAADGSNVREKKEPVLPFL